ILMGIAFLIIFPMGAMLVRFFSHLHHVFRWHRPLQVTGFLIVIAAFACIFVAAYKSPQGPTPVSASKHGVFGVILFSAMVLQICIGIFIFHTFDITRVDRPRLRLVITTWIHRLWGYAVLIGGLVQVNLGMVLYGMWPTGREAAWYVYDAWVVILIAVFVFGSAFKWWRAWKAETANKGV
ncbi:S-methyl-5-thioribose-1-phosphate isomerase, partial [Linnemannia elongata]